jgi:hypothetical protein
MLSLLPKLQLCGLVTKVGGSDVLPISDFWIELVDLGYEINWSEFQSKEPLSFLE